MLLGLSCCFQEKETFTGLLGLDKCEPEQRPIEGLTLAHVVHTYAKSLIAAFSDEVEDRALILGLDAAEDHGSLWQFLGEEDFNLCATSCVRSSLNRELLLAIELVGRSLHDLIQRGLYRLLIGTHPSSSTRYGALDTNM